jgi:glutamate racemase
MTDICRPIGFFDSGIGGISVLKTAYNIMPYENYIYYGDNANSPYGEKTENEIKNLSLEAGIFLFNKGSKAIVMACNTATSAAVKAMRDELNIPVISMEPAVKPALAEIKNGKILVLATAATVSQERYLRLLERLDAKDKVINVGCSGLVELIENGKTDTESIHAYLNTRLQSIKNEKIDAVVIGCTHYSFIENEIMSFIRKNYNSCCNAFDGRFGTAKQLEKVLEEEKIICQSKNRGSIEFFTSGQTEIIDKFNNIFNLYQP